VGHDPSVQKQKRCVLDHIGPVHRYVTLCHCGSKHFKTQNAFSLKDKEPFQGILKPLKMKTLHSFAMFGTTHPVRQHIM